LISSACDGRRLGALLVSGKQRLTEEG